MLISIAEIALAWILAAGAIAWFLGVALSLGKKAAGSGEEYAAERVPSRR